MNQPFVQIRQGTGGPNPGPNPGPGGRPPAPNQPNAGMARGGQGPPPPPPPPPIQPGMARQGMNPYPVPPQPNMGAAQFRDPGHMRPQPRTVEISDIRLERMTEEQIREILSQYMLCRLEKVIGENRRDLDGRKIKPDWTNVTRTWASDVDQVELSNAVRRLERDTRRVTEKKRSLSLAEQRQLEKIQEDLAAAERDPQYQTVLVQIDHLLSNGDSRSHSKSHHSRSHSRHTKFGYPRSKSGSRKKDSKKPKRIALLAYYKRCPKPDVNAFALRDQHDFQTHVLPQQQQHFLAQQQQLQQQQYQLNQQQQELRHRESQFHQQQQQQQHFQNQRPQPGGQRPAMGGKGGNGQGRVQVINDSDSDDSRSSASSHSMWSEGASESTKSSTSRGGPQVKKIGSARPGYYGVKPGVTARRNSRGHDDRLMNPHSPRMANVAPPPRAPFPPGQMNAMPGMAPLPAPMVDQIKAEAYAAGRSDGKVEGMTESRMIVEEEAAIRAAVSNTAYQPRMALPPRIIQPQRAPGVRVVHPDEVLREVEDNLREEQLRRIEQLRLDDLLDEEELELAERRREQARRRRAIDLQWRDESDHHDWAEPRPREQRYYDRQRGAMDYIRRRDRSREPYDNPFYSPRLERRHTGEPSGRGFY